MFRNMDETQFPRKILTTERKELEVSSKYDRVFWVNKSTLSSRNVIGKLEFNKIYWR